MWEQLVEWFSQLHAELFELLIQPLVFELGVSTHTEWAFDATFWFLLGLIEVLLMMTILGVWQRLQPAQTITNRRQVNIDVIYTLLHRLGGFTLVMYVVLQSPIDWLQSQITLLGFSPLNLESLIPGVTDIAWVAFIAYFIALDFVDYWIHRAQHRIQWWWELHAVHHSQQDMTFWSDQRNHLLDAGLRDVIFALVALVIGVAPGQFVTWIVLSRSLESFQHANIKVQFPGFIERLLVSPSFHRFHHAIGFGHEGKTFGCNFGVVLPWWDQLFQTADFRPGFVPTGIRDQLDGEDYGQGFWSQQVLAIKRMFGRRTMDAGLRVANKTI